MPAVVAIIDASPSSESERGHEDKPRHQPAVYRPDWTKPFGENAECGLREARASSRFEIYLFLHLTDTSPICMR